MLVRNRHSGDSTYPQVILANLDQGTERVFLQPAVGEGEVIRVSVGGNLVAVCIATDDDAGQTLTAVDLGTAYLGAAVLTSDASTMVYLDSSPAPGAGRRRGD